MTAGRSWAGVHYDGRTADRREVGIEVVNAGLRLTHADGRVSLWLFGRMRQSVGGSTTPPELHLEYQSDPPERLIVREPGLDAAIRSVAPFAARRLRAPFDSARLWSYAVGGVLLLGAAYLWGIPAFAVWAAPKVPMAWEAQVGASTAGRIAPPSARCTDSAGSAALDAIVERLVPAAAHRMTVLVVDQPEVNAFAAPGGWIVLNSGLLAQTDTPEELAGVLAHEIQHVLLRHSMRAVLRDLPRHMIIGALFGGSEAVGRSVASLGTLHYRRADEEDADHRGIALLVEAGIDPRGMVDFMRKLDAGTERAPAFVRYLSTHPSASERADGLARAAAAAPAASRPLLSPAQWADLRAICESHPEDAR